MLDHLNDIDFSLLDGSQRGIERETLRITADGRPADTPHPEALGEKLTNDAITVDFSENLLELITPPFATQQQCFTYLDDLGAFTVQNMPADELICATSMPPEATDEEIAIADFGHTNSAWMKQIYRRGLANRYNRIMQIISGIHYNFSPSDAFLRHLPYYPDEGLTERKNRLYFRMLNKFHRNAWALIYLFGSSPMCANSSAFGQCPEFLRRFDSGALVGDYATSLRMSELGYQSEAQDSLFVSLKDLSNYVVDLLKATHKPYEPYQRIGVCDASGRYRQLNDCMLQIENEYYSTIRPKQVAKPGERPACALLNRGVSYVEVRLLDIDPFSPAGITPETGDFIEVFLLASMLSDEIDYSKQAIIDGRRNVNRVTKYGRQPDLTLSRRGQSITLSAWLEIILDNCARVAAKMDEHQACTRYTRAVNTQYAKLRDADKTPAAQLVSAVEHSGLSYHQWLLRQSQQHSQAYRQYALNSGIEAAFRQEARQSIKDWQQQEANCDHECSFEDYLRAYYYRIC